MHRSFHDAGAIVARCTFASLTKNWAARFTKNASHCLPCTKAPMMVFLNFVVEPKSGVESLLSLDPASVCRYSPLFLTNLTYECDHRSDPFLWSTGNDSLNRFNVDGTADVAVRLDFPCATASIISRPVRNPFRMQPVSSMYACGLRPQYA